jgi:hypothetical protein
LIQILKIFVPTSFLGRKINISLVRWKMKESGVNIWNSFEGLEMNSDSVERVEFFFKISQTFSGLVA